jgi:hypothetical protein
VICAIAYHGTFLISPHLRYDANTLPSRHPA